MRGDQLGWQWRIIHTVERNPNGLAFSKITLWESTGILIVNHYLEALRPTGVPLYTKKADRSSCKVFINFFKLKTHALLALPDSISLYTYRDLPNSIFSAFIPKSSPIFLNNQEDRIGIY